MKVGNYFKTDDNSKFNDGIVYFRYLRIYRKGSKGGESDYPVYMSISSSSIAFYIQRREVKGKADTYNHSELFQIPLSVNMRARENLGKVLSDIFYTPITKIEENKTEYNRDDETNDTYSELLVPCLAIKDSYNFRFKDLILDFLFDLEHSNIFQNSPYYKKMEESLTSCPFFEALSAKYDYYYKRNVLIIYIHQDSEDKNILKKLREDYQKAYNHWIEIIFKPGMGSIIDEKNKWFGNIEFEHYEVVFDNIKLIEKRFKIQEDIRENVKDSGNWLLRRYDLPKAIRIVLSKSKFKTWTLVILLILTSYSIICQLFNYNEFTSKPDSDFWVLNLFILPLSIVNTLIIIFGISVIRKISLTGILIPRIGMAVCTAWFTIILVTENWLISFDRRIESLKTILLILIISIIIFFFMLFEVKNITQRTKTKKLLFRVLFIFTIAISYSLVIGTISSSYVSKDIMLRTNIASDFWNDRELEKFNNFTSDTNKLERAINKYSSGAKVTYYEYFESLANLKTHRLNDKVAAYRILYKYKFGKFDLYIFPAMLLVNAFIAMFVGIFLQLIFEDKPITEPL